MLYSSYKDKLEKRRLVFERVWRFRALIVLGALILLAAVGALLGVKGIVYGETPPSSVEYGTPIKASANAVMGKASFEYRLADGGEWTDETPVLAGEYECRAVAKTIVGTKRTGDIFRFEIFPAKCKIRIDGNSLVYGDKPQFSANLKYADELIVNNFTVTKSGANVRISVDTDSVTVLSESGADATLSYEFEAEDKEVLDVLRAVSVRTGSAQFTYDGQPHAAAGAEVISARKLAEGDRIVVETPTLTEAGSVENSLLSYRIFDASDEEVTDRYNVTRVETGVLTVLKRNITVETGSLSCPYDGEAHFSEGYSFADGSPQPIEGHGLSLEYGRWTEAGEYSNAPTGWDITDGSGESVKRNYELLGNYGKITISKRVVRVAAAEKSFEYDGNAQGFSAEDYSLLPPTEGEGIIGGHTFSVAEPFRAVNADTYANTPVYSVKDAGGADKTGNYEFSGDLGNLVITRRKISVKFDDEEAVYDGKPHYPQSYSGGILSGHTLEAVFADFTESGEYSGVLPEKYTVTDGKADVTGNYEIEFTACAVKIAKREISARTAGGEWVYDGTPHSGEVVAEGLVEGHEFSFEPYGERGRVGVCENAPDEFKFYWDISVGGKSVKDNYSLPEGNISYGLITVTRRPLGLSTGGLRAEYDGEPHSAGIAEAENLAAGETFSFTPSSSPVSVTEVGESENKFEFTFEIRAADGSVTTDNYAPSDVEYGIIEIYARSITLGTGSVGSVYDGEPHSAPAYTVISGGFVAGHDIKLAYPSFTEKGSYDNRPEEGWTIAADGADVTRNYSVRFVYGKITVTPRPVSYITGTATFGYDGKPHSVPERTLAEGSLPLVEGHELTAEYREWTAAGEYDNEAFGVKVTAGGKDVTGNYLLTVGGGKVKITLRRVTITTRSANEIYDGEYHSAEGYDETVGNLVSGHAISAVYPQFILVGEYDNIPVGEARVLADGADVTENYDIVWVYGVVDIDPRPITISTKDVVWAYDAQCHLSVDSLEISYYQGDGVGHTVKPEFEELFTEAGEYPDYKCTVKIFDGDEDVTEYYDISLVCSGKVTINKRYIRFTTYSNTWVYDGEAHSEDTHRYTKTQDDGSGTGTGLIRPYYDESGKQIYHGIYWSGVTTVTQITDSADSVSYVDNAFRNLVIREGGKDGADKTSNYTVEYNWGKLRVKSPVEIYVLSTSKEYDGERLELTDEDWSLVKKPPDTSAENIRIRLDGSITTPGQVTLKEVYDSNIGRCRVEGEDVYRIDFIGSAVTLEITKREIRISTASIKAVKGEEPLHGTDIEKPYWFSYGSLVSGHRIELQITGVLNLDEETAENTVGSYVIYDGRGVNVSAYYNVVFLPGILSWSDG